MGVRGHSRLSVSPEFRDGAAVVAAPLRQLSLEASGGLYRRAFRSTLCWPEARSRIEVWASTLDLIERNWSLD